MLLASTRSTYSMPVSLSSSYLTLQPCVCMVRHWRVCVCAHGYGCGCGCGCAWVCARVCACEWGEGQERVSSCACLGACACVRAKCSSSAHASTAAPPRPSSGAASPCARAICLRVPLTAGISMIALTTSGACSPTAARTHNRGAGVGGTGSQGTRAASVMAAGQQAGAGRLHDAPRCWRPSH
jgi:hypothetical protein